VSEDPATKKRIPLLGALAAMAIHLAANAHYGFFRDELYFIVCGRHPAFGYVDQPSLTPLLGALSQIFGISLFALRAIPAICAAIATYAACAFALELGAGGFALVLTAIVTTLSPEMLAFGLRLSPDMIEFCTWPIIALIVLRIVKGADPRWWLGAGLVAAVAMWSKYSVLFFAVALVAGLACTKERRVLRSPWFAASVALAALLVLPNFLWQWKYDFPMLQLLRNDYGKFLLHNPPFPVQQIMIMGPQLSLVWMIGLVWLLVRSQTRFLGLAYVFLIAMMWALQAKNYYPASIYPYLVAAGAVAIEGFTAGRRALQPVIAIAAVALAIPSLPFVLPVLPLPALIRYQHVMGRIFHVSFHTDERAGPDIPIQFYADMTGWPQLTAAVSKIYAALPAAQRRQAAVFTHNFGEASAIEIYRGPYKLPPPISAHNTFWIWGPRGYSGNVLIDVDGNLAIDRARFQSVRLGVVFHNPYAMPYENDFPIYVCTGIRQPLALLWPKLKNYSYGFEGL